jgi:multidrug resistance protein
MSKKWIILLTVFIDVLGVGIIIPVLPFYASSLGFSDSGITLLSAVYSLCAFLSAPVLGALSDRVGRKPVLIGSILSTSLGWLVFALASNPLMLYVGRIIDGLAAGNFSTAQAYLSDISRDAKERSHNLGLIGATFGVGFIFGPLFGGLLGAFSHTLPFFVVSILAFGNSLLVWVFLPETLTRNETKHRFSFSTINPFIPLRRALHNKALKSGLISWLLFSVAISIQQSISSLFIARTLGFSEFGAGIYMSLIGVAIALNQGIFIRKFWLKQFKESSLSIYMFLVLAIGFAVTSIGSLWGIACGAIGLVLGQSILRIVITSEVISLSNEKKGEVLGVLSSLMSIGMVIGPLFAGFVFSIFAAFPLMISTIVSLVGFMLMLRSKPLLVDKGIAIDQPEAF